MRTIPPFCPNDSCIYHHPTRIPAGSRRNWYHKDGTYPTKLHTKTQRFVCTSCGTKFSAQTFSLDYGVKNHLPYDELFAHLTQSGAGIRPLARIYHVTDKVILNRMGRLARQAIALHASLRDLLPLQEDLVADGFESFTLSQYFPNNIHLLIGKETQYFYGADYAHLKRKGRMTEAQKRRRQELSTRFHPPQGEISRSFTRLLRQFHRYFETRKVDTVRLFTDEKLEYRRVLKGSPLFTAYTQHDLFRHIRVPSTLPRTLQNDLFAVNYYDRELRKDQCNHVRETVMFSRDVNNCMERLWLYAAYHNYVKPYRIQGKEKTNQTHAEMAGIPMEEIRKGWKTFFTQRAFYTHSRLTESELYAWFRCYQTPLKNRGPWCPQYVMA